MTVMTEVDHAPLLERAFTLELTEDSYVVDNVEGEIPDYLRGNYYLNGPARFGLGGVRYRHWLDGDGMVCALRFRDDGVRFTNRFVRSTKFVDEVEAGRALYRTFGTRFDGDRLRRGVGLESPANVSIYPFAGKLLAFGEQGLPWELDPETLETRGQYTFERKLNPISPFSAHPNFDPESGEMFNFGVSFSNTRPCVNLYRFTRAGELLQRSRIPLDAPSSMHDFGLSPSHVVFYVSPHLLDMDALRRDGATIMDALTWENERGSHLLVASRDGEAQAKIPVGTDCYCLHLVNCFEADGRLVVDVIELEQPIYDQYDVPELFTEVRTARPKRYVIDVDSAALVATASLDYTLMCDFPAIDPRCWERDYRDFWVLGISATREPGRKFFDQVAHCDWETGESHVWQASPGHYLGGEPIFLPDLSSERRGAVICQQLDAESLTGSFLLFDAFDLSRGPVATLPLKTPIHLGFHTSYEPLAS